MLVVHYISSFTTLTLLPATVFWQRKPATNPNGGVIYPPGRSICRCSVTTWKFQKRFGTNVAMWLGYKTVKNFQSQLHPDIKYGGRNLGFSLESWRYIVWCWISLNILMLSTSTYPKDISSRPRDFDRNPKIKMAAGKPEVVIIIDRDEISAKLQIIFPCFWGRPIKRTLRRDRPTFTDALKSRWSPVNRKW